MVEGASPSNRPEARSASSETGSASRPSDSTGAARSGRPRWLGVPAGVTMTVAALVLFPALAHSGIWDPYELDAADLARRIAVSIFGAKQLALPGAANGLPTLTDLRMGELPFTSMALGFRLFGLHDWSGRVVLAVWALFGAAAIYALVARLLHPRAGMYSAVALVTMPLYFMQARTMLGEAVTMAALTLALCGLAGLAFDRGSARLAWAAVGALGVVAGAMSRGVLIGVALPCLSVGLAGTTLYAAGSRGRDRGRLADPRSSERVTGVVVAVVLALGVAAAVVGVRALLRATPEQPLSRLLGVTLMAKPGVESTFDLYVRHLGHALFPWSAFLPFALGRLLADPPRGADDVPATSLRVTLLVAAGVSFAVYAFLAPYTGLIAFGAPAVLAAVVGVTVFDFERGARPSPTLAVGSAALGVVLYRDFVLVPERALAVFAVDKATFPKSFEGDSHTILAAVLALFVVFVSLSWLEEDPVSVPSPSAWLDARVEQYGRVVRNLGELWSGNLVFSFIVVEAALVGLGAMLFFGRRLGWSAVDKMPKLLAEGGLNAWWVVPLVAVAALPSAHLVRDGFRYLVHAGRIPRALVTILGTAIAGAVLSVAYYPALAAQLSPKEVFESYARLHRAGEPLALLGVRGRSAVYYSGADVESFTDSSRAFAWLMDAGESRRWLVVKSDDLPKLNSLHRKQTQRNLPVVDGRSSQILLVSNRLDGRPSESWLDRVVLDAAPAIAHPVDAQLDDQLTVLGWDVVDERGRVVPDVVPARKYRMRFYYRVLKPVTGAWKSFLHIDGHQRRFNGDHAVLDGKYAMSLWQPGDIVVDEVEVQLEPNFGPGEYAVFYGFFAGETRMKVTRGPNHENRVNGGVVRVR